MSTFWELCNTKSQAVLIQLYWQEHGCYPDFYYMLSGEKRRPDIIDISTDTEQQLVDETNKELQSNSDIKGVIK